VGIVERENKGLKAFANKNIFRRLKQERNQLVDKRGSRSGVKKQECE
jgi:hypothetical protein